MKEVVKKEIVKWLDACIIYAISDSDGIPEIWGNEKAGILCIQAHPEDLIEDNKMQNLYNYIMIKARKYKNSLEAKNISKDNYTR